MANEIKEKFSASTALTITLASLGSSTAGVGRQSTLVDNSTARYGKIIIYYKIKQGTSPTGNRAVYFYGIRDDKDSTPHRDFAAGASDAAWTAPEGAPILHAISNKASPSTGDELQGSFVFQDPGPGWGLGIVHDTGVALDATSTSHWLRYVGVNPEVQ